MDPPQRPFAAGRLPALSLRRVSLHLIFPWPSLSITKGVAAAPIPSAPDAGRVIQQPGLAVRSAAPGNPIPNRFWQIEPRHSARPPCHPRWLAVRVDSGRELVYLAKTGSHRIGAVRVQGRTDQNSRKLTLRPDGETPASTMSIELLSAFRLLTSDYKNGQR